ncbi:MULTISPECIES: GGDEF domain-containing protein [unclassified Pseudomonas]|uniref:GGDEF domain-containing protein n=1 Tax=unclassified Pseudomonas TaxID=196821 RepID=UPI00244685CF|nr:MULTISPECIES: GGDEF domain-containing protein [unclassified Pseudomonas]MDH0895189.1 GGDEF domain-containing protein [Pseudomonas sp. GD03875]MDH1064520.1 GGDEF domain-containing protein [Pseudomonas sp. GD03985]
MQKRQPRPPRESSHTGLEDSDRRSLLRLIFNATALSIGAFSVLQFSSGNVLFASLEVIACLVLLAAGHGIHGARRLELWIYLYLLPTFAFILYISLMPQASSTAFVWVYLIPVLSYLMLGKRRGMRLALPFMLLALVLYYLRYPLPQSALAWIDAGNAILCGALIVVFVHLYETRRAAAFAELQHQAQTDQLTGADSRGHFKQELRRALKDAGRSQSPVVLALLDIDHFKSVNDRYGHDAGDHALRHICDLLYRRLRTTDNLGRLGGEEFGLLLRNTDAAGALPLLESLRQLICDQPLEYAGQTIELAATFGLAEWPRDGHTPDELYRCADWRLYQGKQAGRNRVVGETQAELS